MEILFCDLCNESVPQGDLVTGTAYYRKGRLICRDCDRAMGGEHDHPAEKSGSEGEGGSTRGATAPRPTATATAERPRVPDALPPGGLRESAPRAYDAPPQAPPVPQGGGAGGVLLGILALGFSGTAAWLTVGELEEMESEAAVSRGALARSIEDLEDRGSRLADDLERRFAAAADHAEAAARAQGEALADEIAALRAQLEAFGEREVEVAGALAALDQRILGSEARAGERTDALRGDFSRLEKDIRFFSDRLIELEENLRILSAGGPIAGGTGPIAPAVVPGGGGSSAAGGATGGVKAWTGLLADLQSDNPGIRLDAIYALGETRDPEVVPHLVPMLQDEDLFVRMATARMLEDLDARAAVPSLIDALEDDQSAVREAAMVALRALTGEEFGFEPVASPADRARRVKLWRDWWKKNGAAFLAGG